MNLTFRAAWLSASWLVCSAAAAGLLTWSAVAVMGAGALLIPEDQ
jgi:hypothetical protein